MFHVHYIGCRLHNRVGVYGGRVAAEGVPDVGPDGALGDQMEEEQVLEALEGDGAKSRQPQQQRREPTLLRTVRAATVLVQTGEHLEISYIICIPYVYNVINVTPNDATVYVTLITRKYL